MARTWLITGTSSGFGRALAQAVLETGERVFGTVRTDEDARRLEHELPGARALVGDVCEPGAAARFVATAERDGPVDVLVNNAGRGFTAAIEEASREEMRALFDLNVFAPAEMIQAVLPGMRARGEGLIVNVTSISGFKPWSGTGYYCASKFALEGLGQTLAQEVAPFGIRVINAQPGALRTAFNGRSLGASQTVIAAYADGAHIARRALAKTDGKQSGDPFRAARVLIEASLSPAPPLNLLLGADAVAMCGERLERIAQDREQWRARSAAIAFDEDPVAG